MKLFFKRSNLVIIMKEKDVKTLLVIIRYAITFIIGLLGGANSQTVQSLMNM